MAHIEIETPDGTQRVPLDRDRLSIGRLPHNDVVIPTAQISRQHAEIRRTGTGWRIVDMHSTNGIQHNGARIQECALINGDQFLLAPGITVTFYGEAALPSARSGHTAGSQPNWASSFASAAPPHASSAQPGAAQPFRASPSASGSSPFAASPTVGPALPAQPYRAAAPAPAPVPEPTFVPADSVAPLKSRSVYADDEVPFVPPSMTPQASVRTPPATSYTSGQPQKSAPIQSFGLDAAASSMPAPAPAPQRPQSSTVPVASGQTIPGGYPAPLGPMVPGSDSHDLYHRSSAGPAVQGRATSGPAATLLHVCQTCGQRTDPSSTYCQTCHHTIAQECFNCRLSLLPIQDRCPRCHTPNTASVRRRNAHRAGA